MKVHTTVSFKYRLSYRRGDGNRTGYENYDTRALMIYNILTDELSYTKLERSCGYNYSHNLNGYLNKRKEDSRIVAYKTKLLTLIKDNFISDNERLKKLIKGLNDTLKDVHNSNIKLPMEIVNNKQFTAAGKTPSKMDYIT